MIEAIETLRHGDLECKLKAAHLSKQLGLWYKSYCPGGKLMSKSNRTKGFKKSQFYWIAIVIFLEARELVKTLAGVASKRLKETAFCFLYLRLGR
jgi:hypothetical protein